MKRKIIKQGHNTLTITLPSEWVKRFKLNSGDEIDLVERDNGLFVSTERQHEELTTEVDITGLDVPSIWKYFMAIYREGYDEVYVRFKDINYENPYKFFTSHNIDKSYGRLEGNHTPYEIVQQMTNRFIGYEVIEHHKNYCVIKNMVEVSSKEFDSSFRRVFLLIQQMANETLEAINTNNPSLLHHMHDIDINVDKFHDYCVRVLNKTGFKEIRKSGILFATLFLLELVGDEFKNIALHIINRNNTTMSNLKGLCELTVETFNKYYDLFYKFEKEKVVAMSKLDMDTYFYFPKYYKDKKKLDALTKNELGVLNHFKRIARYVNALVELRVEMEY